MVEREREKERIEAGETEGQEPTGKERSIRIAGGLTRFSEDFGFKSQPKKGIQSRARLSHGSEASVNNRLGEESS